MTKTTLIFDMDGLMVDTEPLSQQAWAQTVQPFGIIISADMHTQMTGWRLDVTAQFVCDTFGLTIAVEELIRRKKAIMAEIVRDGVPVMPGLMALHNEIARRRIRWGVATSSPRPHAIAVLIQLGLLDACVAIAAGNEVAHGKPAPDIYLLAAERMGVQPADCLALEDSVPGCQAAAAAGMGVVAIPSGMTKTAVFPCATYKVDSLIAFAAHPVFQEMADGLGN
jgi:HAD superfamily hydrolase (TIGR01509 family)